MQDVTRVQLNDGAEMPQLGLGVFKMSPDEVGPPVRVAIAAGYRLIDTAAAYGNEEAVGQAVRESGLPRNEFFLTTKLANSEHGYQQALRAFHASLASLGTDYLDLYLIHWPLPKTDMYVETWRALEKLRAEGVARSIGVSNFTETHLKRLLEETGTVPAVNQVELHPRLTQAALREFHARHGIVTEAWAPIAHGRGPLEDQTVREVADRYGRSPAQVVLRWHIQLGNVAIPKSATPERIRSNVQIFDFELAQNDLDRIGALGPPERLGPDPDEFDRD